MRFAVEEISDFVKAALDYLMTRHIISLGKLYSKIKNGKEPTTVALCASKHQQTGIWSTNKVVSVHVQF